MKNKVLGVLLWTLFLNLFLYQRIGSGATVLILLGYFVFVLVSFAGWKKRFLFWAILALNAVFSWIILSVDSFLPRAVTILGWLAVTMFSIYLFNQGKFFADLEELFLAPINLVLSYVVSGLSAVGSVPKIRGWGRLFLGLLLGVPIVLVLGGLLSSGDPVFGHFLAQVFSAKFWYRPIGHLIFSLIVFGGFLPLALLKLKKLPLKLFPGKLLLSTEITVVLALVAGLLGAFLIVQWPYVFVNVAAETSLSQFGVATYSEYVKRGFFEFILVALILYGLLWVGLGVLRNTSGKALSFLQAVLFGEFAIFLLAIFRRIYLYQNLHGWSLARIYGGIFLVWVMGLLVTLAIRHWRKKSLVLAEVLMSVAVLIFVGLFNAEEFILTNPPTVNHRVDYVYLSRMSTDGYQGWKRAHEYASGFLSRPYLETITIIGRDDRREVYYSRLIVESLDGEYRYLESRYGQQQDFSNRVFQFSLSEYLAWQQMKREIPREKLDWLKTRYALFDQRIRRQPADDQGWDFDISTNSPFL